MDFHKRLSVFYKRELEGPAILFASPEDEDMYILHQAFDHFDKDNNGVICVTELGTVLRSVGMNPTQAELEALMQEADADGSGTLDFDEFLYLVGEQSSHPKITEKDLIEAFEMFDINNDGKISKDELRDIMTNLGERLSEEEMEEMLNQVDINKDGEISYTEFVVMVTESWKYEKNQYKLK